MPTLFFKYSVLQILLLLFCSQAAAQYDENDFAAFSMSQGLTDNFVTSIAQDNTGSVWIATEVGLNRFEGNVFKRYTAGDKALPFAHDHIVRIKNIGNNHLAILTSNGTLLLNSKTYESVSLQVPDSTTLQMLCNNGWDAIQMKDGNIALTTATGFYVFSPSGKIFYRYDHYTEKDRNTKRILFGRRMYPLQNGEVLVKIYTNGHGIAIYNLQQKKLRIIKRDDKIYSMLYAPQQETEDQWLSTFNLGNDQFLLLPVRNEKSMSWYDFKTGKTLSSSLPFIPWKTFGWRTTITRLNDTAFAVNLGDAVKGFYIFYLDPVTKKINFNPTHFLPDRFITTMFVDKEKRLWVGTDKGVLMQKLKKYVVETMDYSSTEKNKNIDQITCAKRVGEKLFIGNYNFNGLLIVDTATLKPLKTLTFYKGVSNDMYNQLTSIEQVHADTLWLGTHNGLLWLHAKNYSYGKVLPAVLEGRMMKVFPQDKNGNIWVVSFLGGFVGRYHTASKTWTQFTNNTKPGLPFPKVKQVVQDSYGDTWISGHALTRLVTGTQKFDTTIFSYAGRQKYEDDIRMISADASGSLWMHNAYNGILQYHVKDKKFSTLTAEDGLPSNSIDAMGPVINNKLWFLTSRSLGNIDVNTKKVSIFDTEDGFKRAPATSRSMYYDEGTGKLYFFNDDILSRVNVTATTGGDFFQAFYIRSLSTNTGVNLFNIGDSVNLSYKTKTINFQFGAVDFEEGRRYSYSYKIDNNNWIDLGSSTTLSLNGLRAGPFVITIRALGKNGVYHSKSVRVNILYPFWETSWFYTLLALLGTILIFGLVRYRIVRIKQKARIEKEIAQSEMKVLHAQMNPHFMFNSLNSIREMILNSENKEASHYLAKFAQLLRLTLNQSVKTFVSLRETIEHLQRYIEMEQVRNEKFTTRILVDDEIDVDEVFIPPMLVQPFIENALWHGVTPEKKNIDIKIDFIIEDGHLLCKIEDDGVGIEKSKQLKAQSATLHKSMGLENIQNRIRVLNEKYNLQSSIDIKDKINVPGYSGTGTIVRIYLPLNINA